MEQYDEVNVVFMPANTASILQPMFQGVISTFKSHYLRNIFCKATAAQTVSLLTDLWASKWEPFQKECTSLDAIKNIHDSWEQVKTARVTRVFNKLIPTHMDGVQDFSGGSNLLNTLVTLAVLTYSHES